MLTNALFSYFRSLSVALIGNVMRHFANGHQVSYNKDSDLIWRISMVVDNFTDGCYSLADIE